MPVLILKDRCDNLPRCFAATVCPNQALFYDREQGQVVVLPERCGDCRGPCLNFCDRYALKYASTLPELRLLQAELDGSMTQEEIARERMLLKKEEEAEKSYQVPEVTEQDFQEQVLEARLPVLLLVDSAHSGTARQLAAALEQISQEHVSQLMIRRLNSDSAVQLVSALRVRTVPTFLVFYRGQLLDGVEGAVSVVQLRGWVKAILEQIRLLEAQQSSGVWPAGPAGGTENRGLKR